MKNKISLFDFFINESSMFFVSNLKEDEEYIYTDFNDDLGKKEVKVKYIGKVKEHGDIRLAFTRTYTFDIMKPTYIFQVLDDTKYYLSGKNLKNSYFAITEAVVMRFIKK